MRRHPEASSGGKLWGIVSEESGHVHFPASTSDEEAMEAPRRKKRSYSCAGSGHRPPRRAWNPYTTASWNKARRSRGTSATREATLSRYDITFRSAAPSCQDVFATEPTLTLPPLDPSPDPKPDPDPAPEATIGNLGQNVAAPGIRHRPIPFGFPFPGPIDPIPPREPSPGPKPDPDPGPVVSAPSPGTHIPRWNSRRGSPGRFGSTHNEFRGSGNRACSNEESSGGLRRDSGS